MFGSLPVVPFLLAQVAAPAPAADTTASSLLQFLPLVGAMVLFLFLSARTTRQQENKRKEMLNQLKRNDKVLTSAGFYGTIVAVDPEHDRVTLRISEEGNVRVVFARSGIVRVVNETAEKK